MKILDCLYKGIIFLGCLNVRLVRFFVFYFRCFFFSCLIGFFSFKDIFFWYGFVCLKLLLEVFVVFFYINLISGDFYFLIVLYVFLLFCMVFGKSCGRCVFVRGLKYYRWFFWGFFWMVVIDIIIFFGRIVMVCLVLKIFGFFVIGFWLGI